MEKKLLRGDVFIFLERKRNSLKEVFQKKTENPISFLFFLVNFSLVKIKKISICFFCLFFSIPISIFLLFMRQFFRIFVVRLASSNIGYYSAATEIALFKKDQLALEGRKSFFLVYQDKIVCNTHLYKMWKRKVLIFSPSSIFSQVDFLFNRFFPKNVEILKIKRELESWSNVMDLERIFEKTNPRLSFSSLELVHGKKIMEKMGVWPGSKYVCLLVRDQVYSSAQKYRNNLIGNYKESVLYLTSLGYHVIRMGKKVDSSFSVNSSFVIDYASSDFRSDFMDIYLTAHCEFFISTSCGLDGVAQIFRRPILICDAVLVNLQLQYWYPIELFIFKRFYRKSTGRFLNFREIESLFGLDERQEVDVIMEREKIELICNTSCEILMAVKEMELRCRKLWALSEEDKADQAVFWDNIPKSSIPSKKIKAFQPYAMVERTFLNKTKPLFIPLRSTESVSHV